MLAAEIGKAKARQAYAKVQLTRTAYLAKGSVTTLQSLAQMTNAVASAAADVAEAEANHAAAKADRPGRSARSPTPRFKSSQCGCIVSRQSTLGWRWSMTRA